MKYYFVMIQLNLGCGPVGTIDPSYIYVDASRRLLLRKMHVPDILVKRFISTQDSWDRQIKYANVTKLHFQANSVKTIYTSHLLGHLYLCDAVNLLRRCYEWLEIGGIARIVLPDYDVFIEEYARSVKDNAAAAFDVFESRLLSYPQERPTFSGKLRDFLVGDLHTHKWHPTKGKVTSILQSLGFSRIEESGFQMGNVPHLNLIETRNEYTFY